ncbi:hypothetical protein BH20VER1_BH20VER1_00680 [soil metagenome]
MLFTGNGTLNVVLINRLVPSAGQAFDFFDFGAARDATRLDPSNWISACASSRPAAAGLTQNFTPAPPASHV